MRLRASRIRPPTWMLNGIATNTKNACHAKVEIQIGLAARVRSRGMNIPDSAEFG
jgi:hypothetical protein